MGLHLTGSSLTTLNNAIAGLLTSPQTPKIHPLATARRGAMPRILSLVTGSDDEQAQGYLTNGTIAADTVNYVMGGRGWKLTNTTGAAYVKWTLNLPDPAGTTPLTTPPWQAVAMWVYIPDATKISSCTINLRGSADLSSTYNWNWSTATQPTKSFVTGWNFVRIPASFSSVYPTGSLYQAEIQFGVSADTNVTIGHWYLECPSKARFILTTDRGYKTFYDNIYPQMKARKWPVTFAVDCTRFGDNAGTLGEAMTLAQMKACAAENGNSISFHGWDGLPTATMTAAELRADTVKSIKFLQREFPDHMGRFWRAAYVQGSAAQWAAMNDYLLASASGVAASTTWPGNGLGPNLWPPEDWHQLKRISLDNYKTLTNITDWFAQAVTSHLTYNIFVHGYDETVPSFDVNQQRWELFRDNLDTAIAAGWAEVTTFESLFLESGGTFSTAGGATVATYTRADGTTVSKNLL